MPTYAYLILVLGWVLWLTPFLRARQAEKPAKQVDRRARWGIVLVAIAYLLLWQGLPGAAHALWAVNGESTLGLAPITN